MEYVQIRQNIPKFDAPRAIAALFTEMMKYQYYEYIKLGCNDEKNKGVTACKGTRVRGMTALLCKNRRDASESVGLTVSCDLTLSNAARSIHSNKNHAL